MTFLTKTLPRRTVLRGLGATVALPFLDAMHPAFTARARAATTAPHRFQAFYVPNGMAMEHWTPKGEGTNFELSPILAPLAAFKDQMIVLSGLNSSWNYIHAGGIRVVLDRDHTRGPERDRDRRRCLDGSAAGPALRGGDTGAVA